MGQYAEMMLGGTCCSSCGEYIGSFNDYPTQCAGCAEPDNSHRKPRRKMGKKTRALLLKMHDSRTQTKVLDYDSTISALLNRGFARSCKRYGFYELTDEGHAAAEQIIGK